MKLALGVTRSRFSEVIAFWVLAIYSSIGRGATSRAIRQFNFTHLNSAHNNLRIVYDVNESNRLQLEWSARAMPTK